MTTSNINSQELIALSKRMQPYASSANLNLLVYTWQSSYVRIIALMNERYSTLAEKVVLILQEIKPIHQDNEFHWTEWVKNTEFKLLEPTEISRIIAGSIEEINTQIQEDKIISSIYFLMLNALEILKHEKCTIFELMPIVGKKPNHPNFTGNFQHYILITEKEDLYYLAIIYES